MFWYVIAVLVVMLAATVYVGRRAGARARHARVDPTHRLREQSPAELRAAIQRYCDEHSALRADIRHGGHLRVTWEVQTPDDPQEIPAVDRTYQVELKVGDDRTVYVRYGEGKVRWERAEDGQRHGPFIDWIWELSPRIEQPVAETDHVAEPIDNAPHTLDGLVQPLQRIVLAAGFSWQPVVDLESEVGNPAVPEQLSGTAR